MTTDQNPFPQSAVVSTSLQGHTSIVTESLETAATKVADFIVNFANPTQPPFLILGIRGRYGSGKTHLAHQIMEVVCARAKAKDASCISIYAKADKPDLLKIYTEQLAGKLRDTDFRTLAAGYYRKILKEKSEAARTSGQLAGEQSLSEHAQRAVEEFGPDDPEYILRLARKNLLPADDFLARARVELRDTDPALVEEFLRAYSTLLEERPPATALKWIQGQELSERDADALSLKLRKLEPQHARDALKFLLTAYRRAGVVVAFCLDELERFAGTAGASAPGKDRPDDAPADQVPARNVRHMLKDLAETFQESGQVLIVSGIEQAWEVFREDVFQRITWDNMIHVQMNREEARSLLKAHLDVHKLTMRESFEEAAVELLFDVSGLIPRHLLQVAFHSYAVSKGRQITPDDVRRGAALALGDAERTQNVRLVIERGASEHGLGSHYVASAGEAPAIFLGDPAEPTVIVHLMRSLFKVEEVKDARNIASRAVEAVTNDPHVRTCTVVVGYSTDAVRSELSKSVDRVLVYDEDRFWSDFRDFLQWALRTTPVPAAARTLDSRRYAKLEKAAATEERQVETALSAEAQVRSARVEQHALARTGERMLAVLADLGRELRAEELLWLGGGTRGPGAAVYEALRSIDPQRDSLREAEYLNRGLLGTGEFSSAIAEYRSYLDVAEGAWKRVFGSEKVDPSALEYTYSARRNALRLMERIQINRADSDRGLALAFVSSVRRWPLAMQLLLVFAVAGVVVFGFAARDAWENQQASVQPFLAVVKATRESLIKIIDFSGAREARELEVTLSTLRATFNRAAADFQFAEPQAYRLASSDIARIQQDLTDDRPLEPSTLQHAADDLRSLHASLSTQSLFRFLFTRWWTVLLLPAVVFSSLLWQRFLRNRRKVYSER